MVPNDCPWFLKVFCILTMRNCQIKIGGVGIYAVNFGIFSPLQCSTKDVFRSSPLEVFLGKGVLKICRKFTGERPCGSVISINMLHVFRIPLLKNISGGLLLCFPENYSKSTWQLEFHPAEILLSSLFWKCQKLC